VIQCEYSDSLTLPIRQGYFLEKLVVAQLIREIIILHGTRRFLTMSITTRHWSLSYARWSHVTPLLILLERVF